MPISPVLTAESLGKKYGKHWVLQDADLRLYPGQITALMGENGAGKSTLMKILSGAIFPSLGSVSLNGKVLPPGNPLASRNAGIGIVYQELSICPEMSVADNILLGQFPSTLGWLKLKHARQRIRQVLDQLGHPELSPDVTVGKLSVGAQQLVEIARPVQS
ncbi:MAG: ATP-binding cassette domain-containing protein, partial [Planctomycetota bacterium]